MPGGKQVVTMPLGQGITEMWQAVQDRIEVSGHGRTWRVTAGSFDSALAYARERFNEPAVVSRSDRGRWWPRVTLTVTTDPTAAVSAPPLERLAAESAPPQRSAQATAPPRTPPPPARKSRRVERSVTTPMELDPTPDGGDSTPEGAPRHASDIDSGLPPSLEAIFAHQEELRLVRQRRPDHDSRQALR